MMKELSLKNSRLDNRYDILELLGRGSYAEIYVAQDVVAAPQSAHSQIVIKALNVFLQNDLDMDLERTLVENFQNEAIALDRVRHPNVVSRLGHGTSRDLRGMIFHYLVLEYLAGGDLAQMCRRQRLTLKQALDYLEQVCAGLAQAHQHGVIHRDIKPQNLLLTKDLQIVKIADFGVARFSHSDSPITRVGTNIYAPPEHSPLFSNTDVLTTTELTPAADIYSLAKSAYVLITGESPRFFTNQPITALPIHNRSEIWAKDLLAVLNKATQAEPKARHQSVNEFWHDLSRLKILAGPEVGEIATKVSTRYQTSPKAHIARGYTPLAPRQPKFNTSKDLKFPKNSLATNPPLVLKVDRGFPAGTIQNQPLPYVPPAQPPVIQNEDSVQPTENITPKQKKSFFRRMILTSILLAMLAGLLFGTHYYLRELGILPSFSNMFGKRIGLSLRDIPLRSDSNIKAEQIGWVPENSRVKIIDQTDSWFEIEVVEFGRARESNWDYRGWIAKKAKTGEDNVDFSR